MSVPAIYTCLAGNLLMDRRTQFKFDNFTLEWFLVLNGITQRCPLLMIFYAFYNTPLVEVAQPKGKQELIVGFVDDAMFLAIVKDLAGIHAIIKDMME